MDTVGNLDETELRLLNAAALLPDSCARCLAGYAGTHGGVAVVLGVLVGQGLLSKRPIPRRFEPLMSDETCGGVGIAYEITTRGRLALDCGGRTITMEVRQRQLMARVVAGKDCAWLEPPVRRRGLTDTDLGHARIRTAVIRQHLRANGWARVPFGLTHRGEWWTLGGHVVEVVRRDGWQERGRWVMASVEIIALAEDVSAHELAGHLSVLSGAYAPSARRCGVARAGRCWREAAELTSGINLSVIPLMAVPLELLQNQEHGSRALASEQERIVAEMLRKPPDECNNVQG